MLAGASVAVRSAIVAPERAPAKMLTALESTGAEDVPPTLHRNRQPVWHQRSASAVCQRRASSASGMPNRKRRRCGLAPSSRAAGRGQNSCTTSAGLVHNLSVPISA
jgi:hypothetical protein